MEGMKSNAFLETERVGTLMRKYSIPCIISLVVAALYNIVDQIFIGNGVGYLGNGATNIVFPITIIALALAMMMVYKAIPDTMPFLFPEVAEDMVEFQVKALVDEMERAKAAVQQVKANE